MPNPSGRGYQKHQVSEWLQASPISRTEEVGIPVTQPDGMRRSVAFGLICTDTRLSEKDEREDYAALLDTIIIEPDFERVTMIWRIARPKPGGS